MARQLRLDESARSRWRARFPNARWVQLTGKEPIFDSFFKIDLKAAISPTSAYGNNQPTYWGDLRGQRSERSG